MKPSELRIGNLIDIINRSNTVHLPTGLIFRVIAIGMFDVMLLPNEIPTHEATSDIILTVPIRDLCEIKLTKQILDKFEVYQRGSNSFECYFDGTDLNVNYEVKYVHQLQNIYFAKASEELKLKE